MKAFRYVSPSDIVIRSGILCMALFICCCGGNSEYIYRYPDAPDTDNLAYSLYDLYEDPSGQRGIVVCREVEPESNIGYISVLSLDETETVWGPQNRIVYPISEQDLGWLIFTPEYALSVNQIVDCLGDSSFPAFNWCHQKNPSGDGIKGGSWILPGVGDWFLIFESIDIDVLNKALEAYGGQKLGLYPARYWTASEDIKDAIVFDDGNPDYEPNWDFDPRARAVPITVDLKTGTNKVYWSKTLPYRVRAIKYIYYYKPYQKER